MNSKQALDILVFAWLGRRDDKDYPDFDDIHNALYHIEQDLDKLEKLERFKTRLLEDTNKIYNENQKLKKVFEILQEKIIDKRKILNSKNVEEYNNYAICEVYFLNLLTEQEYNLLKEVLENEQE